MTRCRLSTRQGPPRATQRTAPELPGPCPASGPWPSGDPLSARLAVLLTARSRDQMPAHPRGQSRPGRHSAPPWSCPALPSIRSRCLLLGPLMGRLAVLLTARSWGQVPTHPRGQSCPRRRTAPPWSRPASARGPLAACCRPVWPFSRTARSWTRCSPTRSARAVRDERQNGKRLPFSKKR